MNELYLIFAGEDYYPRRGFRDFVEEVDSFMVALNKAKEMIGVDGVEWAQVVNKRSNQIEIEFDEDGEISEENDQAESHQTGANVE